MPVRNRKPKVDFARIKTQFNITDVLTHYGIELSGSGCQRRGRCPIHEGDNETSFSVNLEANIFHCFSCAEQGNHLELIARIEDCSIWEAALKAVEWFGLEGDEKPEPMKTRTRVQKEKKVRPREDAVDTQKTERANKPLEFELKLDPTHPYLAGRGLDPATIERFGFGFCSRGTMKDRIAIPIRNPKGELVAYAGRWVGEGEPPEGEGRYKLPRGFLKGLELFADWDWINTTIIDAPLEQAVVVVEGFFSCALLQQRRARVLSTMGSALTEEQFVLMRRLFPKGTRFILLYDGDEAGRRGAVEAAGRLATIGYTRNEELPDGVQPDHLDEAELRERIPEAFAAAP